MTSLHKATRRKFYPETVACVCRMRVLIHCCLLAPVDGVLGGLLSCMFWFPSAQERQHKMGVWSSSLTRLCESEALFPSLEKQHCFSLFLLSPTKGETAHAQTVAAPPRDRFFVFLLTGAERDIRGSAVTSSCRRRTPSCRTRVSFQTLDTNPPSHI